MSLAADEAEGDETIEIVSDAVAAMGSMQNFVAKKSSFVGMSNGSVTNNSDPYTEKQSTNLPVGDPYTTTTAPSQTFASDPYTKIGVTAKKATTPSIAKKSAATPKTLPKMTAPAKTPPFKKTTPFIPREQHSLTAALFRSMQGSDTFASEAQAAVQAIDEEVKTREKELKLVAEEHFISMKREINEQASQLRKEADAAAIALKTKTEDRVQSLLETAESRMARLNKEVAQEAVKLKQEAAQKALIVMDEMEKRASEKRIQERKKTLASALGLSEKLLGEEEANIPKDLKKEIKPKNIVSESHSPSPKTIKRDSQQPSQTTSNNVNRVSAEWKNDLSRRFYQDMTTMKEIIVSAESPAETQDFLKKFEEQNKWFDLTLRSTKSVTDEQYSQLANKQAQMGRLMQSQNIADDYLQKFTKNMTLEPLQLKKIRLGLLYELNTRTQQRASHLDASIRESGIPDDEIKALVKQVLGEFSQQFRDIAAQFPDVEVGGANRKPQLSLVAVPLAAQKLEADLKEAKELTEATKQELDATQQQLINAQETINQTKNALGKEKAEKDSLVLEKNQILSEKDGIKATALDLINTQIQSNVETELALVGTQEDNKTLKSELVNAAAKNSVLQGEKRMLVGAVEKARKDSFNQTLMRNEDVLRVEKTVTVIQKQAKEQIKTLTESSTKRELSLTTDLRQAHEKIGVLSAKQAKLMRDLEAQQETGKSLKKSLVAAQEQAGKSESQAELANRALIENSKVVNKQIALRKKAQDRAKITEELAQQTIDSINGFLQKERKVITSKEQKLASQVQQIADKTEALDIKAKSLATQEDFLDEYRKQLAKDRDMLETLKHETRKIVQNSSELSESLNDDFVRIQEQIETELRSAQEVTRRELALAEKHSDDLMSIDQSDETNSAPQLVNHDSVVTSTKISQKIDAVMPGAKKLATKQLPARMPGAVS